MTDLTREEFVILNHAMEVYTSYLIERRNSSKSLHDWHFYDDQIKPTYDLWGKMERLVLDDSP